LGAISSVTAAKTALTQLAMGIFQKTVLFLTLLTRVDISWEMIAANIPKGGHVWKWRGNYVEGAIGAAQVSHDAETAVTVWSHPLRTY
jgi:hypothetical protein